MARARPARRKEIFALDAISVIVVFAAAAAVILISRSARKPADLVPPVRFDPPQPPLSRPPAPKPAPAPDVVGPQVCPNCDADLPWMPKRKRKCPSCGKPIFVKRTPSTQSKTLMTEEQANAAEAEWEERNFVMKWARNLRVEPDRIYAERERLGAGFSISDAVWGVMNAGVLDRDRPRMATFHMARFLHEEGRDSLEMKQQFAKSELEGLAAQGMGDRVEVCSSGGCPPCEALDGRILSIADALREMPIPCAECAWDPNASGRGWCRCTYVLPRGT